MAQDFKDFTDFDKDSEPIPIRYKRWTWKIPRPSAAQTAKVDHAYLLQMDLSLRASKDPSSELSDEEAEDIRRTLAAADYYGQMVELCGEGLVKEMLDTGMSGETFKAIFRYVFDIGHGRAEGEAEPPNRAARRAAAKTTKKASGAGSGSSSSGRSSRRISSVSTG